jgi:AcrR family transcriptional regulator
MSEIKEAGTKVRLLHAASRIFAAQGPERATIREICAQAKANVAAVNYHFGCKDKLYVAVLQDYLKRERERHPRNEGVTAATPAQEKLRAYVRSFLLQNLGDGNQEDERLGKLLTQEFIEPSPNFNEIFELHCRPEHDMLLDIIREMLPGADELTITRSASSIIGQCVLFDFANEAISLMSPDLALRAGNIDSMTDFIIEFSLGGVERLKAKRGTPATADVSA